jgi:hypothetical protein|tara:strand:+ start:111 stop:434 length:324 start_codon:yes stop_codon:yes gene_type:complete
MPKNIARITTCVLVACTFVLTQGFLGGTPLFYNDGVAVAQTPAEKAAKKAARKANKAGQTGSRDADKAARSAENTAKNATSTPDKSMYDYNWNTPWPDPQKLIHLVG